MASASITFEEARAIAKEAEAATEGKWTAPPLQRMQ